MKNEDVIKILSNSQIQIISYFADKEYCGEALTTAIETLRKIDVEKIAFMLDIYHNRFPLMPGLNYTVQSKEEAQAIYNYLTERINSNDPKE